MISILGYCFLCLGALFMVTAGVGLLRMPDFYTRLHPAGVADSLGAPLMIIGIACLAGGGLPALKLVLLVLFLLITGPTACHALAKAAHSSQLRPQRLSQNIDPLPPLQESLPQPEIPHANQ